MSVAAVNRSSSTAAQMNRLKATRSIIAGAPGTTTRGASGAVR